MTEPGTSYDVFRDNCAAVMRKTSWVLPRLLLWLVVVVTPSHSKTITIDNAEIGWEPVGPIFFGCIGSSDTPKPVVRYKYSWGSWTRVTVVDWLDMPLSDLLYVEHHEAINSADSVNAYQVTNADVCGLETGWFLPRMHCGICHTVVQFTCPTDAMLVAGYGEACVAMDDIECEKQVGGTGRTRWTTQGSWRCAATLQEAAWMVSNEGLVGQCNCGWEDWEHNIGWQV